MEKKGHPFIIACSEGKVDHVRVFVKGGLISNVNMQGTSKDGWTGFTGLGLAAKYGHVDVVRYLLSIPNIHVGAIEGNSGGMAFNGSQRRNSLHYCAFNKNVETLQLLLNHDTCTLDVINARDSLGRKPLDYAKENNYTKMIMELANFKPRKQNEKAGDNV